MKRFVKQVHANGRNFDEIAGGRSLRRREEWPKVINPSVVFFSRMTVRCASRLHSLALQCCLPCVFECLELHAGVHLTGAVFRDKDLAEVAAKKL